MIPVDALRPVHIAAKKIMKINGTGTPRKSPNCPVNDVSAKVPLPNPNEVNARIWFGGLKHAT